MDHNSLMAFDWSEPKDDYPSDLMSRAHHAKHLTKFLVEKGKEGNYVLNINATWGSGKTYFLKRWMDEISPFYPSVYIDSWSSDNSDEPLLCVVSEVIGKLKSLKNISKLENNIFEAVARVIKIAAPSVMKSVASKAMEKYGIKVEESIEIFSNEEVADFGGKLVEKAIQAHEDTGKGVVQIKDSIQKWLSAVVENQLNILDYPLFIFIDELDRCRPTYAIEMLETIKHIFDMKNVVFVIATDKEQLQHSIKAIYGEGFNSRLYLDRFFTRTVTLNETSRRDFITYRLRNSKSFKKHIDVYENFAFIEAELGRNEDVLSVLTGIADGFRWPLRTVKLWLDRLEASLIISDKKLELHILSFLMALETEDNYWVKQLDNGQDIFPRNKKDFEGKLIFEDFELNVSWTFANFTGPEFDVVGIYNGRINERHEENILFSDFFKVIHSNLRENRGDSVVNINKELEKLRNPTSISLGFDMHGSYSPMVGYIYSYYHEINEISIKDYLDLCRYSALMN